MELFEWSKHYIKFKDCMKKNIQHTEFKENIIFVKEKKQNITYYITPDITKGIKQLKKMLEVIITLNTKKNFDTLINNWDILKKYEKLTIIFAHPNNNQTWIIHPYTHNNIVEKEKLKKGLITLFNNISKV